jgi:peptidoglycan/LPS O-acetylase OafA/YrhL
MATVAPLTSPQAAPGAVRNRLAFIDNLRSTMIVLVVSMHAAVTYSHLGSWYFMEDPKPSTPVLAVFATYQVYLQAFFMGLLFFIAGYFVPAAFDRKGFARFAHDRAVRLGLPSLFYMLIIQPLTVYWLLRTFANPSIPPLTQAYTGYISGGRFLGGSGPMWFAVALLCFSLGYGALRIINGRRPRENPEAQLPSHLQVIGLAAAIGLCSFLVRIVQPMGTNILNMQLCFFSQYVFLFIMGILAWRRNWLLRIPYEFGIRWLALALTLGSLLWVLLLVALLSTHSESKLSGGFSWQSAAFSFWESFFCLGLCLGLIVLFRERFNQQGKLARGLAANSFSIYLFHPPLLIAVTLAMRGWDAPKLLKFLCATLLGLIVSYLGASLVFRRIPYLNRVL